VQRVATDESSHVAIKSVAVLRTSGRKNTVQNAAMSVKHDDAFVGRFGM
jgi:hypothetical protein